MSTTIRILVNSVAPLDGATPIDLATAVITQDPVTGETVVSLPAQAFGSFDPGVVLGGLVKSNHLVHLSVQSKGGAYGAGDVVRLAGPRGGALSSPVLSARPTRIVVPLDAAGMLGVLPNDSGQLPEGLAVPVPVDHVIEFDTAAGAVAGPHTILMTLIPVPKLEVRAYQFASGL